MELEEVAELASRPDEKPTSQADQGGPVGEQAKPASIPKAGGVAGD
jgi:hypothetical protein